MRPSTAWAGEVELAFIDILDETASRDLPKVRPIAMNPNAAWRLALLGAASAYLRPQDAGWPDDA